MILAVVLSLAFHLALLFFVKVLPAPRPPVQVKTLQVELGDRVRSTAAVAGVVLDSPRALRQVDRPVLREPIESPPDPDQGKVPKSAAAELDTPQPPAAKESLLPTLDMALVDDPTYYTGRQVDVHPQATEPIRPDYPEIAAQAGVEGYAILRLLIDENGALREVSAVDGNPPGIFEGAALRAFRNSRFAPAQRNGRVVKSEMIIKVTFELNKVEKKPAESKGQ